MKFGTHVGIVGGYAAAVRKVASMGGSALQFFSTNPHEWGHREVTEREKEAFRAAKKELGVNPVYFHAPYLINLADPGRIGKSGKTFMVRELSLAAELGVRGSIVHVGSWKKSRPNYDALAATIRGILAATPKESLFIFENSGTRKIGVTIDEIGTVVEKVKDERLKVCLDTCHLFTAGYGWGTRGELDTFLTEFDKKVGLERLEVWHLNDSRDPFHSYRDRHENIGDGYIGLEPFRVLLNHPKMKHLPFILEVPGFAGEGPDRKNLDVVKKLAGV
ncbi:MAG: deoxyribonuclease IV [Candidatus Jorgensenbacteria bacterium]